MNSFTERAMTAEEMLKCRHDGISQWLADEAPYVVADQKHLDENTPERAYWHYGYKAALADILSLFQPRILQREALEAFVAAADILRQDLEMRIDVAPEIAKPVFAGLASLITASNKAQAALSAQSAQGEPTREALRKTLENAALFLTIGANYAPNEKVNDQNKATGEWLRTRGLGEVMREVAEDCRAALSIQRASSDGSACSQP